MAQRSNQVEVDAQPQARPCRVRVAIPHYYKATAGNTGHGSCRGDRQQLREIALARCLGGLLALNRGEREELLRIDQQAIQPLPVPTYPEQRLAGVHIDLHLFVTGDEWLQLIVRCFEAQITVHKLALENPRQLPHAARKFLLNDPEPADLWMYLEDDLVVQDRLYIDKLIWFLERTQHRFSLMPHRWELTGDPSHPRLFVDGPLDPEFLSRFQQAQEAVAEGRFWDDQQVKFDVASNPHAGFFALSSAQRALIAREGLSTDEFIGPLETVATLTVLQHFPVMKPSWSCRDFLAIEHGHPSFLIHRAPGTSPG